MLVVSFDFIRYFMISCLFKCLVVKDLQLTIHIVCTIFDCEILVFSVLAVSNVNISKSIIFFVFTILFIIILIFNSFWLVMWSKINIAYFKLINF